MKNLYIMIFVACCCVSNLVNADTNSRSTRLPPPSKATVNFCEAGKHGNVEMMDLFLQQGAVIDSENCPHGEMTVDETPLIRSVDKESILSRYTDPKVFDYLITHNANPNFQTSAKKRTALMYLVKNNDDDFVMGQIIAIFGRGAKVDIEDAEGNTALYGAALASSGGPLDDARKPRKSEIIRYLVTEQKANVNHKNKNGQTPLMMVAQGCLEEETKLLIQLGADAELKTPKGETAISFASERAARSSDQSCNKVARVLQGWKNYVSANSNDAQKTSTSDNQDEFKGMPLTEIAKKFEINRTTLADVTRVLGNPISQEIASETGRKVALYGGNAVPFNTLSNIPISAIFGMNKNLKGSSLAMLVFDKNDVLIGMKVIQL